jgi:hypothetical protein
MLLKSMVDEMAGILTSSKPVEGGCAPLFQHVPAYIYALTLLGYYSKACFPGHLIGGSRPRVRGDAGKSLFEPITCGIL